MTSVRLLTISRLLTLDVLQHPELKMMNSESKWANSDHAKKSNGGSRRG